MGSTERCTGQLCKLGFPPGGGTAARAALRIVLPGARHVSSSSMVPPSLLPFKVMPAAVSRRDRPRIDLPSGTRSVGIRAPGTPVRAAGCAFPPGPPIQRRSRRMTSGARFVAYLGVPLSSSSVGGHRQPAGQGGARPARPGSLSRSRVSRASRGSSAHTLTGVFTARASGGPLDVGLRPPSR